MRQLLTVCCLCALLTGCSGWNISRSDERNGHFRTLANISHFDENTEKEALTFDIRKRERSIMAERTFYENGAVSASFIGGRHRQYRWMTGIVIDYSF
jgi:hypothetical protein